MQLQELIFQSTTELDYKDVFKSMVYSCSAELDLATRDFEPQTTNWNTPIFHWVIIRGRMRARKMWLEIVHLIK